MNPALNSYCVRACWGVWRIQYSQFGRCETSAKGCCNWLSREWREKEGDVLISIDTGSGSISAGQIVTFAGDPNQYVVAAATSNLITLAAPGLRQDLADDTAITVVGAFTANMAFDRNAFLLASRTPAMPEGGDNADDVMNVTDPISGITFQIALYRQYRRVRYEVGLAWGVSSVKPAHGCLILG